jgi:hypothetical protein
MSIVNSEMYRICHNPSICGEEKAGLALARECVGRQSLAALANPALHRMSGNTTAGYDDRKLKPVSDQYIVCMSMRPFSLARFSAQR